jgi:hypothetical protein
MNQQKHNGTPYVQARSRRTHKSHDMTRWHLILDINSVRGGEASEYNIILASRMPFGLGTPYSTAPY